MIDTVRGSARVRKWPAKRGKPKSAKQQAAVDWFRDANHAAKRQWAPIQIMLHQVTAGTPFMPRDLAIMAMAGRLFRININERERYTSMAARQDVSEALDELGHQVGSILARTPEGWRATLSPQLFGGWFHPFGYNGSNGAVSSTAGAWKGNIYRAAAPGIILATNAFCNFTAGHVYRMMVARLTEADEIDALSMSPAIVATTSGTYWRTFPCGMDISETRKYCVAFGRTDGSASFALPVHSASSHSLPLPLLRVRSFRQTTGFYALGDTIVGTDIAGAWGAGILGAF